MKTLFLVTLGFLLAVGCASTSAANYRIPQEKQASVGAGLLLRYQDYSWGWGLQVHGKLRTTDADEVFTEALFLWHRDSEYFQWDIGWIKYFQPGLNDGGNLYLAGRLIYDQEHLVPDLASGLHVLLLENNLLLLGGVHTSLFQLATLASNSSYLDPRFPFTFEFGLGTQCQYGGINGLLNLGPNPYFAVQGFATPYKVFIPNPWGSRPGPTPGQRTQEFAYPG